MTREEAYASLEALKNPEIAKDHDYFTDEEVTTDFPGFRRIRVTLFRTPKKSRTGGIPTPIWVRSRSYSEKYDIETP